MKMTADPAENLAHAEKMVWGRCRAGACKSCFCRSCLSWPYFCQERRDTIIWHMRSPYRRIRRSRRMRTLAQELGVVLTVSFYERGTAIASTIPSLASTRAAACSASTAKRTSRYDHYYQREKFYFSPGDTGFRAFETKFGTVGIGICWDQWFPEAARAMALLGADILLYPTAIGSEPILVRGQHAALAGARCKGMRRQTSSPSWRQIASAREHVVPCARQTAMQESALTFYSARPS